MLMTSEYEAMSVHMFMQNVDGRKNMVTLALKVMQNL